MKRTLFWLSIAMMSSASVFAQKSNVSKAGNLLYQDPVDYAKAQEYIEMAKMDSTTAKEAKTWYIAGRIGYSMANKEVQKMYLQQQPDNEAMYTGLDMMFTNYVQADKYDGVLDKKGNVKYKERKNIKGDFKEMLLQYYNVGGAMFNLHAFDKSYIMFDEFIQIVSLPMFADEKKPLIADSTLQEVKYYAAIAASRSEKHDIAIAYAGEVANANGKNSSTAYQLLASEYMTLGDTVNYLATLQKACEAYPTNPYFVGTIVNYYVMEGKTEEAMKYIDQEIERNPANIEFVIVKADLLVKNLNQFDQARAVLQPVLDANPQSERALLVMGDSYTAQADYILAEAEKLDLSETAKYNKEMERMNNTYREALKFYEPLRTIMSADNEQLRNVLLTMRGIYQRLGDTAKYQEVNAELQTL